MNDEVLNLLSNYARRSGYLEGVLMSIRLQELTKIEVNALIGEALSDPRYFSESE